MRNWKRERLFVPNAARILLGFCVPIVGLVLFLVWRNEKPRTAKVAGVGALIAVIISVIWYVLALVAGVGAMFLF